MDEAHKELVKRLRDQKFQYSGPQPDVMNEVADALEALAGEVAGLNIVVTGWIEAFDKQEARAEAAEAERDRLKAEHDMHLADAIDAAPAERSDATAVCVWEKEGHWYWQHGLCSGKSNLGGYCPACRKPIKFTEANHG